jgi:hypothetical protein
MEQPDREPLLVLALFILLGGTAAANASSYHVTLQQVGSDVVATGSGAIDLTGLVSSSTEAVFSHGGLQADEGAISTGGAPGSIDIYVGSISGPHFPDAFGSGSTFHFADSSSGGTVGISPSPLVINASIDVPHGYLSHAALSDSSTYLNATFASLGVTPGTYVWTWGAGAEQSFTLEIGNAVATPLPAALPLFAAGLGALGLLGWRRRRKAAAEAVA